MPLTQGTAGSGGGGGGGAVTINNPGDVVDGAIASIGAKADAAATTDTGTFSLIALSKRLLQKITSLLLLLPAALTGSGNFKVALVESTAAQATSTPGVVSTANSTTATLTAGSTFTGTAEDVSGYAVINVSIFADQPSVANGFSAQFSSDGTNWDITATETVTGGTGQGFFFKPRAKFFRLVYTNDGTNQGAFRLQTVFHPTALQAGAEATRVQNTAGSGLMGVGPLTKSVSHGSDPTAVTSGNFSQWYSNVQGIPFVMAGHPNIKTFRATFNSAQTDQPIISVSAGTKIVVTSALIDVDAATTATGTSARLGFGTATTPTGAGVLVSSPGIAPGSGVGRGNGAGMIGVGADDEDIRFTCGTPTGGNIDVNLSYFTVPS